MQEHKKDYDKVVGVAKALWKCNKEGQERLKFAIYKPEEVADCGGIIPSTITAILNEGCKKLDSIAEQLKYFHFLDINHYRLLPIRLTYKLKKKLTLIHT